MHRRTCPTRSLEAFVRDFADVRVHQQRSSSLFFQHHHVRTLSTRPPLRVENDRVNDADLSTASSDALYSPAEEAAVHEKSTADGVVAAASLPVRSTPHNRALDLPALSQHLQLLHEEASTRQDLKTATGERSRRDSRLLRKRRRQEEGRFGSLAKWQEGNNKEGDVGVEAELQATLDIIDGLDDSASASPDDITTGGDGFEGVRVGIRRDRGLEGDTRRARGKAEKEATSIVKRGAMPQPRARSRRDTGSQKKSNDFSAIRTTPSSRRNLNKNFEEQTKRPDKETWQIQKAALVSKFGESGGWQPRKRVSPDTLEGIRALHASDPTTYTTPMLAEHFKITPEAIRRILRSKWKPKTEEVEERMRRWERRGVKKWEEMSAQGSKPPKRWRELGVPNPVVKKKWEDKSREREEAAVYGKRILRWEDVLATARRAPVGGSLAERIL